MDYEEHEKSILAEWGGLMPIIDPEKVKSGDVAGQQSALNHNLNVFPNLIEVAKNDLVDLTANYNKAYLKENDKMDDSYCMSKNIKSNQKNIYIEKVLHREPDSIGSCLEKVKNRIKSLEDASKSQLNLLWTYNKGNR